MSYNPQRIEILFTKMFSQITGPNLRFNNSIQLQLSATKRIRLMNLISCTTHYLNLIITLHRGL